MPIVNGEYVPLTEETIRTALESELQEEFGANIDLTESSVFTTLATIVAAVKAENQEQSLQEVYESSFLETATGIDLERVVAIVGLQRRDATNATGVQRFNANGKVTQTYTVQSGTLVQTDESNPIQFETTQPAPIRLVDDYEGSNPLANYSGDTPDASVVEANAFRNDHSLELDPVDGAHVYRDITVEQGVTLHGHVRPRADTVSAFTFGIDPDDVTNHYHVAFDEAANEARLERVSGGSVANSIDTVTTTIDADTYYEAEIDWSITDNLGVSIKDENGDEVATLGGVDDNHQRGHVGLKSLDANAAKNFDWYTMSSNSANISAVEGGADGNVGAESITQLPSPPPGVDTTTNLYPTGTTDYTDRSDSIFVIGRDVETDEELRERAQDTVTGGGDATHNAMVSTLVNDVDGVSSVTIFENKTDDDNTGSGGLPPYSFEAVVFGGQDDDVAEAIFDKKAITSRDYAGAHGDAHSVTVTSEVNGQAFDIDFSRPFSIDVNMTLDVVVDETYIGDDALRDRIVQYVGGLLNNGSEVIGLGVGENVLIDALHDIIVGADDTGVVAFDHSVDGTPIETTPSYTTVDGIRQIEVADNEVAQANAATAAITINARET